jgi:hypothetical protein
MVAVFQDSLQKRIAKLQHGWANFEKNILEPNQSAPEAILFSNGPFDDDRYESRAQTINDLLNEFRLKTLKIGITDAENKKLRARAINIYKELYNLVPDYMCNEMLIILKEDHQNESEESLLAYIKAKNADSLNEKQAMQLFYIISANNAELKNSLKQKLEQNDKDYKDYKENIKKLGVVKPALTHEIIAQQHKQMCYDPFERLAAFLMGSLLDALFEKEGIPALPKPIVRTDDTESDKREAATRNNVPTGNRG